MRQILKAVLCEKVPVRKGDRTIYITKYEVILNVLVNAAVLKGNNELGLKLLELVPPSEMQRQVRRRYSPPRKIRKEDAEAEYWRLAKGE